MLSENKKFRDETEFWILMGFDHAWYRCPGLPSNVRLAYFRRQKSFLTPNPAGLRFRRSQDFHLGLGEEEEGLLLQVRAHPGADVIKHFCTRNFL